jgi:hypothetical protein
MKRTLMTLALLALLGASAAAAQTRVSVSMGFGVRSPYAGYVFVGRPYRPYFGYRRPAYVIVEPAPLYARRPFLAERVFVRRHRFHYRPYHRYNACWDHRCRF